MKIKAHTCYTTPFINIFGPYFVTPFKVMSNEFCPYEEL